MTVFYCAAGQHLVSGRGTLLANGTRICKDCRIRAAQLPDDSLELVGVLKLIWSARDTLRSVQGLDQRLRGKP